MKTIGFVDYYLSEWHANNYPAWIKQANSELGTDYQVKYAWAEKDISPVDGVSTDEWCKNMGTIRCESIEELCEKCDTIVILSPSNPEKHLEYAKKVLPFKKPTYIDKPFADTKESANEIFAIAEKYGTPFFSTSALRYATELDSVKECTAITTLGGGSNLEEYIIHQAEMVVKKLGIGAKCIKAQAISQSQYFFTIKYTDNRMAGMHFVKGGAPFVITLSPDDTSDALHKNITSDFFYILIKDIIKFFEEKMPSFNTQETLEVNKILVSAVKAKSALDEWIEI